MPLLPRRRRSLAASFPRTRAAGRASVTKMPKRPAAPRYKRIAFVASSVPEAQDARRRLTKRYGDARPETADVIVALGGDALMLPPLHPFTNPEKPIYGMHRGTVGFLM